MKVLHAVALVIPSVAFGWGLARWQEEPRPAESPARESGDAHAGRDARVHLGRPIERLAASRDGAGPAPGSVLGPATAEPTPQALFAAMAVITAASRGAAGSEEYLDLPTRLGAYRALEHLLAHERDVMDLTHGLLSWLSEQAPQSLDPGIFDRLGDYLSEIGPFVAATASKDGLADMRNRGRSAWRRLHGPHGDLDHSLLRECVGAFLGQIAIAMAVDDPAASTVADMTLPEVASLLAAVDGFDPKAEEILAILQEAIEEGRWPQFGEMILGLDFSPVAVASIDRTLIAAMSRGDGGTSNPQFVFPYLAATPRGSWPEAREFIEAACGYGEKAASAAGLLLPRLRPPPDASYVAWAIDRYPFYEFVKADLKKAFGL